jgi:hypothetical protein
MTTTVAARPPGIVPVDVPPNLVDALNCDWQHRYERRLAPAPRGWASDALLAGYRFVVEALSDLEEPATPLRRREELLVALAARAASGDTEAARVVVQHLLPCLVRDLRWRPSVTNWSREESLNELVSAAWQAVAGGVERRGRPMKIALLRTIEYTALCLAKREARTQLAREVFVDFATSGAAADLWGRPVGVDPTAEEEVLALLVEAARAGLDPADVRLLGSLTLGCATASETALMHRVSERWIRQRRAAAARRLANLAA